MPPSSQHPIKIKRTNQHGSLLGWALGVVILTFTTVTSTQYHEDLRQEKSQYHRLADALLTGKTNLDLPIPEGLLSLANPYKASQTQSYINAHAKEPLWDTSFYKGKIYLYYGVVPVVTLLVPYKALTGNDMDMRLALLIFSIIASTASILCLNMMFSCPQWGKFLTSLVLTISPGYGYLLRRPEMYEIAIVAGSAFGLLGLFYITKSLKTNPKLNMPLGASLWALSIGCRPTMLLSIGAPILAAISRLKMGDKKSPIFAFLAILLIASLLGLYNYSRFDSPIAFGDKYVLTGLDTGPNSPPLHRLDIIKENIKIYLFQPPHWDWEFPYTHPTPGWHGRHGQKIGELTSGITATSPIAILAFLGIFYALRPNRNRTWWAMISSIWLPILLLTSAATLVSMRFVLQFSPAMILAGCAVACTWISSNNKLKKYVAVTLLIISLPTPIFLSLKGTYGNLEKQNPSLYNKLKENFHLASDPLKNLFNRKSISLIKEDGTEILVPSINFPETEAWLRHNSLGRLETTNSQAKWTIRTKVKTKANFFEWRFVSIGPINFSINGEEVLQSPGGPIWTTKYLPEGTHDIEIQYFPQPAKKQLLGFYRTQKNDQSFYPIGQSDGDIQWKSPK